MEVLNFTPERYNELIISELMLNCQVDKVEEGRGDCLEMFPCGHESLDLVID